MTEHRPEVTGNDELKKTALNELHAELGGRLIPFSGYELPIQYDGVLAEHHATREAAGLFDVSHMKIVDVSSIGSSDVGETLELIAPGGLTTLGDNRLRYSMLTNDAGGIVDDVIFTRMANQFRLVLNASRADIDLEYLDASLGNQLTFRPRHDLALISIQGPRAVGVLQKHDPAVADLSFMEAGLINFGRTECDISRSGYTGEDGFEIAMPNDEAEQIVRLLLLDKTLKPAGLGARDTLRLEAGLCLYGNELNESTTPVEANLSWTIPKRRRQDQRFPGASTICSQLEKGTERTRVGVTASGKRPIRDGAQLFNENNQMVGLITSGGYSPTTGKPVAMGYIDAPYANEDNDLTAVVRGKKIGCTVAPLPFVQHRYKRSK
ncbi:MAG: glycine cleavage system aminomethyltransferase GcvT [Actinomycetota bacterium]|nr:glycine cleavage system aminomethyltransferase GcvT [Actinomycetota bacterium]MDG2120701.1 glycine cleavage system aminomethyltransferase GcvT [Actinomycetota bacterium]